MSDEPNPSGPFTPDTDEELDRAAIISVADIADAVADLRRKLPDIAEAIINGTAEPADATD